MDTRIIKPSGTAIVDAGQMTTEAKQMATEARQMNIKHSDIRIPNADIHKEYPNIVNGKFIKYHTILIDPPWSKGQKGVLGASQHYDLMSIEEIRQLPINELLAENGHLYLWVTNGVLEDAFQLLKDWGLKYRSIFTWVKPRLGLGQYFRNCSEQILFATKGKAPVLYHGQPNWSFLPVQDHSHKPEEVYEIIERLSPGPYLEMFARQKHPGWHVWGREVKSNIIIHNQPVPHYSFNLADIIPELRDGVKSRRVNGGSNGTKAKTKAKTNPEAGDDWWQ